MAERLRFPSDGERTFSGQKERPPEDEVPEYFQGKWIHHSQQVEKLLSGDILNIIPVNAELVPTLECPFNCPTCTYIQTGWKGRTIEDAGKRLMDFSSMKLYIDRLQEAGIKSITFTGGGEPFANPFTIDGIDYAKQKGLDVGLFTNGALLNKETIQRLMQIEPVFIRLSLNAGTKKIHDRFHGLRRESFFDKVINNLGDLAEEKVRTNSHTTVGVGVIVNPVNAGNLKDIGELLRRVIAPQERDGGIDYVAIRPTVIYRPDKPQYPREMFEKAQEEIKEQVIPILRGTSVRVANIEERFIDVTREDRGYKECLAHPWAVSVAYDGGVYLCAEKDGMEDYCFGNLLTQSFDEIWQSKRRKEIIENIRDCPPICKLHFYNQIFTQMLPVSVQDLPRIREWIEFERRNGLPEHVNFP